MPHPLDAATVRPLPLAGRALDTLDRARGVVLSLALATRPLAFLLRRRARRIEARAVAAILLALALSIFVPALMLAVGPIAFGIPHIAGEVRYLVVRRGLGRGWIAAVVAGCVLMSGLRLLGQITGEAVLFTRLEVAAGAAWVAGGALLAAHRGRAYLRLAAAAPLILLAAVIAVRHAVVARLLFVHLHNFGAILLWIVFFRRRAGVPLLALAALAGSLVLLASGATVGWSERVGGLSALGVDVAAVARWLAPGVVASVAVPLALVHAFSDSVHYTMWLGVIPEEEIRAEGSLTFRMSARSLVADLRPLGVSAVILAMGALVAASLTDLAGTRALYFSLAGFHGYLELAVVAFLLVSARARPSPAPVAG